MKLAKPARLGFLRSFRHHRHALKQPVMSCTLHFRNLFFTQLQLSREDGLASVDKFDERRFGIIPRIEFRGANNVHGRYNSYVSSTFKKPFSQYEKASVNF